MSETKFKDPDSISDFTVIWDSWFSSGDSILTSIWLVPSGITKVSDSFNSTSCTIRLSGGTIDYSYNIVNRVTTANGLQEDQTLFIVCKQN